MAGMGIALRVTDTISATNSGLYYMHSDHLGSLSLMTDVNGDVVADSIVRHLPFGGYSGGDPSTELRNLTDAGYTGHKMNDELGGMVYMRARHYSSDLRRFVSADTIIPEPNSPLAYNRFSYVYNSPIVFTDPSGHCRYNDAGEFEYNTDCTQEEFESLSWDDRIRWVEMFMEDTGVY